MFKYLTRLFAKPSPPPRIATIPSFLHPYVTPFGSRVWGGATDDSDIDLLIDHNHIDTVCAILQNNNIQIRTQVLSYSMMVASITFTYDTFKYQISAASDQRINTAVAIATEFFHQTPSTYRDERIRVFETIVDVLKGKDSTLPKLDSVFTQWLKSNKPELLI